MKPLLRRYWFEFDLPSGSRWPRTGLSIDDRPEAYVRNGVGITGYDEDDCLQLLREQVFGGQPLPPVRRVIRDVDVSTIPPWFHTHQQVGVPVWRGVWAPPFNLWSRSPSW